MKAFCRLSVTYRKASKRSFFFNSSSVNRAVYCTWGVSTNAVLVSLSLSGDFFSTGVVKSSPTIGRDGAYSTGRTTLMGWMSSQSIWVLKHFFWKERYLSFESSRVFKPSIKRERERTSWKKLLKNIWRSRPCESRLVTVGESLTISLIVRF